MTVAPPGLPDGFALTLDPGTRQLTGDLWFGGSPARVVRLTASGRAAWAELRDGVVRSPAGGRLGRRFTDAGLAHPVPPSQPSRPASTTVIVPVYNRVPELRRCLTALGSAHPIVVVDDGSTDPDAIAAVCAEFAATLVPLSRNSGPGAARNAGLARVTSEFVAFVDSDCQPAPGWLEALLPHFRDPLVGAVAPRVCPIAADTWSGRYTRARSSIDLGGQAALVRPGSRVTYVPTAALVARRAALVDAASAGHVFDPSMRVGEDVDLVWRMGDAGWRIRYDPSVRVGHHEPSTWVGLLRRRFRYGSSAALLARTHPDKVAPLVLHPWPALTVAAILARRPSVAVAGYATAYLLMARKLRRANVPRAGLMRSTGQGAHQTWIGMGRWSTQFAGPLLVAAVAEPGSRWRRFAAATLLLGPPVEAWIRDRPPLDGVRFVLGNLADDMCYGAGVLAGSIRGRTTAPVRPAVTWRNLRIEGSRTTAAHHSDPPRTRPPTTTFDETGADRR